jgi:hypothetical protein
LALPRHTEQNVDLVGQLTSALQRRNVSIVEFAESDEFCGKALFPRQKVLLKLIWLEELDGFEEDVLDQWIRSSEEGGEVRICPNIRERVQILRDAGFKHFNEVVLVGGRRSSKGHVTGISVVKKLYDLVNMDDPHAHYGVDPDKEIYAAMVANSLDQAKMLQFADATGALLSCKALERYMNKALEEEFSLYTPANLRTLQRLRQNKNLKLERDIAKLRGKPFAANAGTIRGTASIVAVLDEVAFMLEGVSKSSGEEIYKALKPSLEQFKEDILIFLNSSPWTKIGQFYAKYEEALAPQGSELFDPRIFMLQFPSWELYRDWDKDPKKRFKGPIMRDVKDDPLLQLDEQKSPATFAVERRAQFAETVQAFLNPNKVDEMFGTWNGYPVRSRTVRHLGPKDPEGREVIYKGHADPATTTANFGFAIGHTEWAEDRDGNERPHVVFDVVHAWIPDRFPDKTINYLTIQNDISDMIYMFRPQEFSFDQYESRGLIDFCRHDLGKRGAGEVRIKEVTATERLNYNRYKVFEMALNLNLVHAPADSPFAELAKLELKFLQDKCHDDKTEVLTENGWRFFKDILPDEKVATRNSEGDFEWQLPSDYIEMQFEGDLYVAQGHSIDFAVSPNHKMLVSNYENNIACELIPIKDLNSKSRYTLHRAVANGVGSKAKIKFGESFPVSAPSLGNRGSRAWWNSEAIAFLREWYPKVPSTHLAGLFGITTGSLTTKAHSLGLLKDQRWMTDSIEADIEDFASFLGFWMAEGTKARPSLGCQVEICQKKMEGIIWVEDLLQRLQWQYSRYEKDGKGVTWRVRSKALKDWLSQNTNDGRNLPKEVFTSWPQSARESLLEGFLVGDGLYGKREGRFIGAVAYHKSLVDDLQALASMCGWNSRVYKNEGSSCWKLALKSKRQLLDMSKVELVPYSGNIFCLTVPNGTLLTRRNGITLWSGNSGKIVKQDIGPVTTKDVADCLVETVYYLLAPHIAPEYLTHLAAGGEGGYGKLSPIERMNLLHTARRPEAPNPARNPYARRGRPSRFRRRMS